MPPKLLWPWQRARWMKVLTLHGCGRMRSTSGADNRLLFLQRYIVIEDNVLPAAEYLVTTLVTTDSQRISTNAPFAAIIPPASSKDAYRLYPPSLRRGTGGHRESHAHRRTSPQNHHRHSPRKEVSARSHHLPDRLRLRYRATGRRGGHRHCSGRRPACHDHAWLREHALGHRGRDAAPRACRATRGERCAADCRHALRLLSG